MASRYRYFSDEHAERFVRRGEVLFRALSYFRDYEDAGVRADCYEGTLVHRPVDGLKATLVATGEEVALPFTFESTARDDDIFVYCLSTARDQAIAARFGASTCVEVHNFTAFLSRVRGALALRRQVQHQKLVHGDVKYYAEHDPPIVDWALPERISLRKPMSFQWQHEYRIAVPINHAFDVENVQVKLVPIGARRTDRSSDHPSMLLKLGDLSDLCRVHTV